MDLIGLAISEEFARVGADFDAAKKAFDDNEGKISKYGGEVAAHAAIKAAVIAGTNEKYATIEAWTKKETKLAKFVSLYTGKIDKLNSAFMLA